MNISYDVELYREPCVAERPTTSVLASSATYFQALQNVVTWLESEVDQGDATHITERRNGWDIHYPNHTDTIDIVEYHQLTDNEEYANANRRAFAAITPDWG